MARAAPTIVGVVAALAAVALTSPVVAVAAAEASLARNAPADSDRIVHVSADLDGDAAVRLHPGDEVSWLVTVWASRDDGRIDVSLDGTAPAEAFTITVRECPMAWTDRGCPAPERAERVVRAGERHPLGSLPSSERRWYRLDVGLQSDAPTGATARLIVYASGRGTSAQGGIGPDALAPTGGDLIGLFGPAVAALGAGIGVAAVARWRRRADSAVTAPVTEAAG